MKPPVTVRKNKMRQLRVIGVIALVLFNTMLFAQQRKVSGMVVNPADDKPISDVSVRVKGTSRGTNTNEKGSFSISVSENEILVFSAVGFLPREVKVGKQERIDLQLNSDVKELDNVVVTALGIKRQERALGYSTATLKTEDLTTAMSGNWTDALSGKVAGLSLIRSNSGPAGSNKIVLRGPTNLLGGASDEALIVVDGVVINSGSGRRTDISGEAVYGTGSDNMPADYGSNLNDINPNDIETLTILKGPSAAALYGERGANGAVMITTKSGVSKQRKMNVSFNSNANMEQANRWPDLQYEYGQGLGGASYYSYGASADGASTSGTSSAYGPRFDGQMFYQYNPGKQGQDTVRTPWVGYRNKVNSFFQTGHTYTNTISIEGGTDKTNARFSYSNVKNDWIIPQSGYKRNSLGLSVTSKMNDQLQITAKATYNNKSSDNLPGAGYGNQSIMYWYIFWQPNADIDWLKNYWMNGQAQRKISYPFSTYPENPYAIVNEFLNKMNRNAVTGNVQATYTFSPHLSLQVRTTLDLSTENRSQQRPYDAGAKFTKGSFRTQNIASQESGADFLLKYDTRINTDVKFSFTAGGSTLTNTYTRDEVRADSLTVPGIYTLANNAGPLTTYPYKSKYKVNSLYALMSANYKELLYLDLTCRQDWNSTLATPERTDNAGFTYPSAALSFILSDVVKMPAYVDVVKLRLSASSVGSGTTIPYRTSFSYTSAGPLYDGGLDNPALLTNPNLVALRTNAYETGANVNLFKNRLSFDITVYTGNTKDQILERRLDQASGFQRAVINAGVVNNKGIELSVNATPVITRGGFKWSTGITYSTNKNKISSLPDSSIVLQTGPVGGGQLVAKVGGSMGDMYGKGFVRAPDGQIVFDPTTGFAKLTEDVIYIGNTIPKGKLGWINDFSYKGFNLHLLFDAQWGAVSHSLTNYKLVEQGKTTNTLPGRYNGIIGNGVIQGADGKYVKNTVLTYDVDNYYRSMMGADNAEGSTFSTDFIKFREASLSYTFKPKLLKRIGLSRAQIGIYGRDLFIWTPWPIFDPEFGTLSGTDIVRGFEVGQFPSTRSFGANLIIGL
ncbi:MAG: SusC/RagA family TonB-linked outer membrane protein [Filimonas sp.]|nr:SusC/RagA family TonB-linked outer membrane protein [Filimonas sp.]